MKQFIFSIVFIILTAGFVSAESETERTITVLGMASTDVVLDKISWSLNVTVKDSNQEKLRKEADKIIAKIKEACNQLGIADDAVEYSRVTINMRYKQKHHQESDEFSHYELSQHISITQKDFERYEEYWQEFTSIESIRVSQSFYSSDLDATRRQLRLEAVQSAKEKAAEFAEIVDMKIGKTISISEFSPNSERILNSDMNVQYEVHRNSPRNVELSAKIYVVFELL